MKRLLLALALSLAATAAQAQTVILARHAEKADQSSDPMLSAAGQDRAAALALTLDAAHLTHVFISPLQRTRLTAAPSAASNAVVPVVVGFDGGTPAHVQAVADQVRQAGPEATVLVVGHSNTIPLIARALGFQPAADMADCEYDRLTVLHLDADEPTAVVSRYGLPSACE